MEKMASQNSTPPPLSRADLEIYQKQTEAANARLIEVLKEVAVHFNTITNQLMLLAKSNEDLLGAMLERVHQPLSQSLRDHHEGIKEIVALTLAQVSKEMEKGCQSCIKQVQDNETRMQTLLDGVAGKVNGTVKAQTQTLQERFDKTEKDAIKGRTLYTLIISAFIAAATLFGVVLKSPSCQQQHQTSQQSQK